MYAVQLYNAEYSVSGEMMVDHKEAGHNSAIEADLAMVRGLMTESSRAIHDTGWHHVLWGSVVASATVLTHGYSSGWFPLNPALTWGTAVFVGWVLSFVAGYAADRQNPAQTGAGRVTRRVWIAVGVSLTVLGFVGIPTGAVAPRTVSIVTALLLAGGYFASSVGPALRWFLGLAAAWWVGAVALLLIPADLAQLAFAAMMLLIEVGVGLALVVRNRGVTLSAAPVSV